VADEVGINLGGAQGKPAQYIAGRGTRNVTLVCSLDGMGAHVSLMHGHGPNFCLDPMVMISAKKLNPSHRKLADDWLVSLGSPFTLHLYANEQGGSTVQSMIHWLDNVTSSRSSISIIREEAFPLTGPSPLSPELRGYFLAAVNLTARIETVARTHTFSHLSRRTFERRLTSGI
jgi:hypothetical protein